MADDWQTVLGIDPGRSTGWAVVHGDHLLCSGVIKFKNLYQYLAEARVVMETASRNLVKVVAIEDQYLDMGTGKGKTKTGKVQAFRELVRCRAWWEVMAVDQVLPFATVSPVTWQSKVLGINSRAGRDSIKKHSQDYARLVYGLDNPHTDVADAICIAKHISWMPGCKVQSIPA